MRDPQNEATISFEERVLVEPLVWFDAYNAAFRGLIYAIRTGTPIIGEIEMILSEHAGPRRTVLGDKAFNVPMKLQTYTANLSTEAIKAFDLTAHKKFVEDVSAQSLAAQHEMLQSGAAQAAEIADNVVGSIGQLTLSHLREIAGRMEVDVDWNGNVRAKDVVVYGATPEQRSHIESVMKAARTDPEIKSIVAEKVAAVEARRRKRRLLC
jgi:hypothetical protein